MVTTSDRRTFKRFRVKEGVLAVNGHVLGPILNLSIGGMCFEYFDSEPLPDALMNLGIFFDRGQFLLTGIKNKTVYDTVINSRYGLLPVIRKQRSIQFINLTSGQLRQIHLFLRLHTLGPT